MTLYEKLELSLISETKLHNPYFFWGYISFNIVEVVSNLSNCSGQIMILVYKSNSIYSNYMILKFVRCISMKYIL